MINLRYHIISLTAVFLALGLGLTMGSTFLDRATVDTLNNQLDGLERELNSSDERISELESELDATQSEIAMFTEQGLATLLEGELAGVPVMLVATRGTDEALVTRAQNALSLSGASVNGTWWVTERFALDDDAELRDLASILELTNELESRLRRSALQQLSAVLLDRMLVVTPASPSTDEPEPTPSTEPEAAPDDGPSGDATPADDPPVPEGDPADPADPAEPTQPAASEPPLLSALRGSGFLEFQPVGDGDVAEVLASSDLRIVIVTDADAVLAPEEFVVPLTQNLTVDGPAALVLATGITGDGADRGQLVDLVRTDDALVTRLSTLDHLDDFAGQLALAFAVGDTALGRMSHYGLAPTASRLFPPADGPT